MTRKDLEIVTGPYRSGKSMRLLSEIVAYCRQAPLRAKPVFLTVPSHRYKTLVEQRLAEMLSEGEEGTGLLGLKIMPFYELCQYVLRRTGESFRLLPGEIRASLIAKAIASVEAHGELSALAPIAHFAGTHAQVLALIDELERAALSPRDVLSTLASTSASDSRYIELGRIYEAYWAELNRLDVYDERKLAFKTREVASALSPGALGFGLLVVDGFDRFNRLQLSVLQALSRQCDRTLIGFDYVDQSEHSGAYHEYRWKEKSFKELKEILGDFKQTTMPRADMPVVDKQIFRSLDRALEMEEIARGVKESLAKGMAADEMIVVARSLKPYLPSIKTAFERASIQYFLDEAIPLDGLPLIKYLRRLLSLSLTDFTRLDVLRVLSSPYCKRDSLGLSENDVKEIDGQSIKNMVVSGLSDWQRDDGAFSKVLTLLERIRPPQLRKRISEHVSYVEDMIDDFLVLANEEEYADPLVFWEEHQSIFEFRRVLANLIYEDELLAPHFGPQEITYLEFCRRLDQTFENANFRRPKLSKNAVTICSADLVPNRCFKNIFVSGLIEGEFPRRGGESGFLSRDEVKKWLTFGIDIENPRHHETFELSLYNSLLERATEKLVMSAPLYELSGEELMLSFFLTSGETDLAEIPYLKPRLPALTSPVSEEEFALALLFNDFKLDDYASLVEEIAHRIAPALSLVESRTAPGALLRPSLLNGCLVEQVAAGLAFVHLPELWSVSRLNDYGKCPFRFWVSHVLGIKPPEEPEAGLDALLVGEFYHKALELFYRALKEQGLTILAAPELVEPIFKQAVDDALAWLSRERPFRETEFWDYEKKELAFRLSRFFVKEKERALRDAEQFEPAVFEKGFGFAPQDPDSTPALVIYSGGRQIRMRGRVDRLDISQDGKSCRIIDYKSGSQRISTKEALAGRNMQMPIYALAARQSIAPHLSLRDGLFLSVSQGEAVGRLDFQKDGEEVVAAVVEHVGNFVANIERGDFSVRPADPQVCTNCDHRQVCRISEIGKSDQMVED